MSLPDIFKDWDEEVPTIEWTRERLRDIWAQFDHHLKIFQTHVEIAQKLNTRIELIEHRLDLFNQRLTSIEDDYYKREDNSRLDQYR